MSRIYEGFSELNWNNTTSLTFKGAKKKMWTLYQRRYKEWKISRKRYLISLSSVQFSHSVMSDSLQPHDLQHARPPCPSPTPGVHPNPCPLSRWCHPTISSSVVPFSSCPQSFPASGSFQMSQVFAWGGQSIEENANQNHKKFFKTDRIKCWWGRGGTGTQLLVRS